MCTLNCLCYLFSVAEYTLPPSQPAPLLNSALLTGKVMQMCAHLGHLCTFECLNLQATMASSAEELRELRHAGAPLLKHQTVDLNCAHPLISEGCTPSRHTGAVVTATGWLFSYFADPSLTTELVTYGTV